MNTSTTAVSHQTSLEDKDPQGYLQHQVQLLYELLPSTQWVHVAAALTVFGLLFKYVDLLNLISWLGFVLSILAAKMLIDRRYQLSGKSTDEAQYWFNWFLLGATLYGIMWSATAILLVPSESGRMAGLTALILCGLASGGVAISSVNLKVYFAYAISIILPYAGFLIASSQDPHAMIGWMMVAFAIVIMIVAIHVHHFFSNLIELQIKAKWLKDEVRHENQKRQVAEKALLDNSLEEELAILIREQSHKLRNNKSMDKLSESGKNAIQEMQGHYINYIGLLMETVSSQIERALGVIEEFKETSLSENQGKLINILDKTLCSAFDAIHGSGKYEHDSIMETSGEHVYEKVNIRYMLTEISVQLPLTYKAKHIAINRNYAQGIPRNLYGNKNALWRILNELVLNAAKHTDGGLIDVNVNVVSEEKERLELEFSIEDKGAALPEEIVEYLRNGTHEEEFSGTGLANAKQLLDDSGSHLIVSSVPGAGSQMKFNFAFLKPESGISGQYGI